MRVGEFAQNWLENVAKPRVRITTLSTHETQVRLHIVPHLGGIRLNQLTPLHLQAWHATLEKNSVSPRQRQSTHVLLKTILRQALKLGLIARNPSDRVRLPASNAGRCVSSLPLNSPTWPTQKSSNQSIRSKAQ